MLINIDTGKWDSRHQGVGDDDGSGFRVELQENKNIQIQRQHTILPNENNKKYCFPKIMLINCVVEILPAQDCLEMLNSTPAKNLIK